MDDAGGFPTAGPAEDDDGAPNGAPDETSRRKPKSGGFQSMGLSPAVYRSIMRKGYKVPTPIQRKAIPVIMGGQDVVAMARTGSGKTAAFLLPLLEKLKAHSFTVGVRAVILSPTRELAVQTHKFCSELSHFMTPRPRFCCLVGGDAMEDQFDLLAQNPDCLVATPGRLQHILAETQLGLTRVEYVVFDEADRLFEMGFATQLHAILAPMPEGRQTCLFSATLPSMLADFTRAKLHEPQLIRLDLETKLSETLDIQFFKVRPHEKLAALLLLLGHVLDVAEQQTIVFAATRHHVELLHELCTKAGFSCCCIYGTLDPAARKIALARFRARKAMVMIVTDVAARGIDVPLLDNVINFDFPAKPKLFVHRAGRAARAGRSGRAISLLEHEELPYMVDLMLYLGRSLRTVSATTAPADATADATADAGADAGADADADADGAAGAAGGVVLGGFAPTRLESEVEYVDGLLQATTELEELQRVAARAMQMAKRNRGPASKASVQRARGMPVKVGIHPLVRGALDVGAEARRADMLATLQGFRPGGGLKGALVVGGQHMPRLAPRPGGRAAAAAAHGAEGGWEAAQEGGGGEEEEEDDDDEEGGAGAAVATAAAKPRRARQPAAAAGKQKRRGAEAYRDAAYFMPAARPDEGEREAEREADAFLRVGAGERLSKLDQAVMDLVEDEREGIQKRRSIVQWDAKKKKYVRQTLGLNAAAGSMEGLKERGNEKRMRNEAGALVKGGKDKDWYAEWRKGSKRKIQAVGEAEEGGADGGATMRQPRKRGRYFHTKTAPLPNADAKSELRSDEQITKQRRLKAAKSGKGGGGKGGGGKGGGGKGGGGKGGGAGKGRGVAKSGGGRGGGGRGGGRGGGGGKSRGGGGGGRGKKRK